MKLLKKREEGEITNDAFVVYYNNAGWFRIRVNIFGTSFWPVTINKGYWAHDGLCRLVGHKEPEADPYHSWLSFGCGRCGQHVLKI